MCNRKGHVVNITSTGLPSVRVVARAIDNTNVTKRLRDKALKRFGPVAISLG